MTTVTATKDRLPITLLVLRLLVFGVFLMWALGKILNADQAARIYETYYSLSVGRPLVTLIGVLELGFLGAFLIGYQKRLTRAILLVMMSMSCLAPGRFYLTPFHDHILLYFAAFPTLAVVFMLYYLRDRDTLWTVSSGARETNSAVLRADADPRLPLCLFLIRAAVFFDLFMWNMDKFFHPLQTSRIFAAFYNVGAGLPGTTQLSYVAVYLMGALQLALILAFLVGVKKRFTYALVFVLHTVSTFAPWERFLQPFTSHTLLFLVSFAMLGGIGAMYYLRAHDALWALARDRGRRAPVEPYSAGGLPPIRIWSREAQAALVLIVVAGLYILIATGRQWRVEQEQGPALIAELQERMVPSEELASLKPEWDTSEWTATWHSANCTFSHPTIDDCWEIHFIVWGQNVMPGRRQVEAGWIVDVDGDSRVFHPNNNASDFFHPPKAPRYTSPEAGA